VTTDSCRTTLIAPELPEVKTEAR